MTSTTLTRGYISFFSIKKSGEVSRAKMAGNKLRILRKGLKKPILENGETALSLLHNSRP